MADLKLNLSDHDIALVDGDFDVTETEAESLQQRLKIKLLTFKGEWYLNTQEGVPYFQSIFGKNRAKESIDAIFKQKILEEPEVQQLIEFSSSIDNVTRVYRLQFRIKSINEDTPIPIDIEI